MSNRLRLLSLAALLVLPCAFSVKAQEGRQANAPARTSADESSQLDIPERRITRDSYRAATSVEIGGETAGAVSLRVGAEVTATTIDVLLRGVTGQVRFKASLDPLLARINSHRRR